MSAFPSYEMKGGLLNLLGICACSISSKNSDRAALHKGQLMASFDAYATQEKPTFYQQSPAIFPLIGKNHFGRMLLRDYPQYLQILQGIRRSSFFDTYPILLTPSP